MIHHQQPVFQSHIRGRSNTDIRLTVQDQVLDLQRISLQQFYLYTGELFFEYRKDAGEDKRNTEGYSCDPDTAAQQMVFIVSTLIEPVFQICHFISNSQDVLPCFCQGKCTSLIAYKEPDAQFFFQFLYCMTDGRLGNI